MNDQLLLLQTLKSLDVMTQIASIEYLSLEFQESATSFQTIIRQSLSGKILITNFEGEKVQVVQLALLSIVAADIGTIPTEGERRWHLERLNRVALHFGIGDMDIQMVLPLSSQIEQILETHIAARA